jgi:hypothetical protein
MDASHPDPELSGLPERPEWRYRVPQYRAGAAGPVRPVHHFAGRNDPPLRRSCDHPGGHHQRACLERHSFPLSLFAAFKGLGYAVRAYQDGLCGVMLTASGKKAGAYSSMNKQGLAKVDGPIAQTIDRELPEYREWFERWKAMRDQLKLGRPLGMWGDTAGGIRIRVGSFAQDGTIQHLANDPDWGLPDVITALRLSEELGVVVTSFVADRDPNSTANG